MENTNEGTVTISLQRYKELEKFEQDFEKEKGLFKREVESKYQAWRGRYRELTKSNRHAQDDMITKLENTVKLQEARLMKVRITWFGIGIIIMKIIDEIFK